MRAVGYSEFCIKARFIDRVLTLLSGIPVVCIAHPDKRIDPCGQTTIAGLVPENPGSFEPLYKNSQIKKEARR